MRDENRIVSFTVLKSELQGALKDFSLTCSMSWRSNPIQVIEDKDNLIVIVKVEGDYYPYMDSQLDDIGKKYESSIYENSNSIEESTDVTVGFIERILGGWKQCLKN